MLAMLAWFASHVHLPGLRGPQLEQDSSMSRRWRDLFEADMVPSIYFIIHGNQLLTIQHNFVYRNSWISLTSVDVDIRFHSHSNLAVPSPSISPFVAHFPINPHFFIEKTSLCPVCFTSSSGSCSISHLLLARNTERWWYRLPVRLRALFTLHKSMFLRAFTGTW